MDASWWIPTHTVMLLSSARSVRADRSGAMKETEMKELMKTQKLISCLASNTTCPKTDSQSALDVEWEQSWIITACIFFLMLLDVPANYQLSFSLALKWMNKMIGHFLKWYSSYNDPLPSSPSLSLTLTHSSQHRHPRLRHVWSSDGRRVITAIP